MSMHERQVPLAANHVQLGPGNSFGVVPSHDRRSVSVLRSVPEGDRGRDPIEREIPRAGNDRAVELDAAWALP